MSELGNLLKNARGDRSLREIANLVGVSHTYLNILEKGKDPRTGKRNDPSVDMIKKLAAAYRIPFEQLMIAAGYISSIDEESKKQSGNVVSLFPTTGDSMDDLPQDAIDEIERFKEYIRHKYKKK